MRSCWLDTVCSFLSSNDTGYPMLSGGKTIARASIPGD